MNNSNNISNELREISPLLAGMQKVNVFAVPAGYFDGLADAVTSFVCNGTTPLLSITFPPPLESLSRLSGKIEEVNNDVPTGYFEGLADNILNKIKALEAAEEFPVLNSIAKTNVYTIPQGYFEGLADNILNKKETQQASDEITYPVLGSISKANVYTVPKGYFETLIPDIVNQIKNRAITITQSSHQSSPAPSPSGRIGGASSEIAGAVITMPKRNNWLKYAVAAAFVGVMALGAYQFIGSNKTETLPGYVQAGMQIKNVEAELEKVTDEDIIKYLQAEGSDVDAALVAGTIDEKELPTQEDYLMDEKALDKYLENIDLNDLKN